MKEYVKFEVELPVDKLKDLMDWHIQSEKSEELRKYVLGDLFNSYINGFCKSIVYDDRGMCYDL